MFFFSDWMDWQRNEKKRIRILDLIDSVRKNTTRKPGKKTYKTSCEYILALLHHHLVCLTIIKTILN
jgi:hypothetical protein